MANLKAKHSVCNNADHHSCRNARWCWESLTPGAMATQSFFNNSRNLFYFHKEIRPDISASRCFLIRQSFQKKSEEQKFVNLQDHREMLAE